MSQAQDYVLGQSAAAARRLHIQDTHFAEVSEILLDNLGLPLQDRVVELGCGPGAFSKRILRRLGTQGVLRGIDSSVELLEKANADLNKPGGATFETVTANITELGSWLDGADAVVGRAVLHHVPMVEMMLGRLRTRLKPGTKIGLIEPDFRSRLARLDYLECTTRPELAPLRTWARAINQLYQANGLSPCVGASLAMTLYLAGYRDIRSGCVECRTDDLMIENMVMFYDEVADRLCSLGIMSVEEVKRQQDLLKLLPTTDLPAVWAMVWVACEA